MKLYDGWNSSNWSTFDAKVATDTQISDRESGRSAATTAIGGAKTGWFSSYSVVGIQASEIPNMRDAIRNYVNGITTHLDNIEPLATADNAFKNEEVQTAVQTYIAAVKKYCMNLTTQLLAFSDKLQEVYEKYEENMRTMAGNIGDSTSSLNTGTTYTEKM